MATIFNPKKRMVRQGFTLLEMALVFTVIGLLFAGVLVGKDMVRSAEQRNAIGEFGYYVKAIKEYEDKYNALPGDDKNAETIWGTDPGGCVATAYNTVAKKETCNGDGLGTVGSSTDDGLLSGSTEWFRAWQHMSNANFIKGSFTGARGITTINEAIIGINVPTSDMKSAGWTFLQYLLTCNGDLWGDQYGHVLVLGTNRTGDFNRNVAMTPVEALVIDQKIDDGFPGLGKVRAWRTQFQPNCTVNDTTQADQRYADTDTAWACSLVFLLGF